MLKLLQVNSQLASKILNPEAAPVSDTYPQLFKNITTTHQAKMSTKLRWQSMDLIAKLMYPIMWRHIVMYNPKTRHLEYKLTKRQFLVYSVTEFYLIVIAGSLCPFLALTKYILVPGVEPMPLENLIYLIGFGASCVFDSLISLVDLKVKDDICPAFNGLAKMEVQFESGYWKC